MARFSVAVVSVLSIGIGIGCGRVGFDDREHPADAVSFDTPDPPDTPPAPDAFACPAARRSSIDAAGGGDRVTGLVAVPTSGGLELSYLAPGGVVYGTTYAMTEPISQLVADQNLAAGPATSLGVLVQGGRILTAWSDTTHTELEHLDDSLKVVTAPTSMAHTLVEVPFATGGGGEPVLAMAYQSCGCGEVSASRIDIDGVTGTTAVIAAAAETPTGAAIVTAQSGFLATWIADSPMRAVRGALLAGNLAMVGSIQTLGGPTTMAIRSVRSAWSPATATYLIAWEEGGAIRAVIADASLAPAGAPFTIAASGTTPRVTGDAQGFWIVWNDGAAAVHLAMARVAATGAVTPVAVTGSGGTVTGYDLVTVGGAAQLVWVERGGSGRNLWIVPACSPT
jgi:hypothetical protein